MESGRSKTSNTGYIKLYSCYITTSKKNYGGNNRPTQHGEGGIYRIGQVREELCNGSTAWMLYGMLYGLPLSGLAYENDYKR